MTIVRDFDAWPRGPLHLAIGAFDGVHVGHQALVRSLAERARAESATPVVTTFDPLPIEVLAPGAPPSTLTDIDRRVELLAAAGAGAVVVFHFTREFSQRSADEFATAVADAGDVRRISVGADFKYGHDRTGNVDSLRAFGAVRGFVVDVAPAVTQGGGVVSSTRVRNALLGGDVDGAFRLLGRRYTVKGAVESGPARGRALGYPTLSVDIPRRRILPRDGIYATWVNTRDGRAMAACSIGVQPTAGGSDRRLELFLLDRNDAPSEAVEVEFVKRLRDELRFERPEELSAQIARDIEETRRALGSG